MEFLLYGILSMFIGWGIVTIIFRVIENKVVNEVKNEVYVAKPTKIELSEEQQKVSNRLDEMLNEFKTK